MLFLKRCQKNSGRGLPSPPPLFGQCLKETIFYRKPTLWRAVNARKELLPKEYFNKAKAADRTKYQKMEGWLQKPSHRMRLVKGGDTPADDEILLKKVFLGKKCMVYIAHFLGAKSFFSKNCHFLEKKIYTYFSSFYSALMKSSPFIFSRASVRFSSYV